MSSLTAPDVFDSIGSYGGNQMSMDTSDQEYLSSIVKKYFPNLTDSQIKNLLYNATGTCWDYASINTLLEKYKDDPKGFQKKFGVPLMAGDDFNFNGIALTYLCWVLKHHPDSDQFNLKNLVKIHKDKNGQPIQYGAGATEPQICQYWPQFCKDHGVKVDSEAGYAVSVVNNKWVFNQGSSKLWDVTPKNWAKKAKGGTIILSMSPTILYNLDGSLACNVQGGHAVDITGVTDSGDFIVSSWGKEYLINPNDGTINGFDKITYE
jgi:hypothetical protein